METPAALATSVNVTDIPLSPAWYLAEKVNVFLYPDYKGKRLPCQVESQGAGAYHSWGGFWHKKHIVQSILTYGDLR
jgi:hypothetical protein